MSNDTLTQSEKDVRLFHIAVERAEQNLGKAVFDFQPLVVRKALVAQEILTLVNSQDEDVADARVRQMALALDSILSVWAGK